MKEEKEAQIIYISFMLVVLIFILLIVRSMPRNVIVYVDTTDFGLRGCMYIITVCLLYMCYEKYPEVKSRIMGLVAPNYFSLQRENEKRKKEIRQNRNRLDEIEPRVNDMSNKIQEIDDNSGNQRL